MLQDLCFTKQFRGCYLKLLYLINIFLTARPTCYIFNGLFLLSDLFVFKSVIPTKVNKYRSSELVKPLIPNINIEPMTYRRLEFDLFLNNRKFIENNFPYSITYFDFCTYNNSTLLSTKFDPI